MILPAKFKNLRKRGKKILIKVLIDAAKMFLFLMTKTSSSMENYLLSLTFTLLQVLSPGANTGRCVSGNWFPFYDETTIEVFQ